MADIPCQAGICPLCGCDDLEYDGYEVEETRCVYDWHCPKCDTFGREWHRLVFSGHSVDEEGYIV